MNVVLLRQTFARVAPQADQVAQRFYARLFATYPQVRPLFRSTDLLEQRKKLMASVAAVVAAADRPEALEPVLAELGRRHHALRILPRHYGYVAATLLSVLADTLGSDWTPETAETWDEALDFVAGRMLAAA